MDVLERLKQRLPGRWDVRVEASLEKHGERYDIVLERRDAPGLMVVERMSAVRIKDLLGRFALSIVQEGELFRREQRRPMVVIAAPRFGRRSVNEVERFFAKNAPDMEWGVVDEQGTLRIRAPSLGLDVTEFTISVPAEASSRYSQRLFSDLNRWMLKILMLRKAPLLWGGPRDKPGTPTDLHRIAGVSLETAHRFVRTFEKHDYLRRTRNGLKLVRCEALLDAWVAAERLHPPKRNPVSRLITEEPIMETAFVPSGGLSVGMGGFEACRRYGLLHTDVSVIEVHVPGNWRTAMDDWRIEICDEDQADLFLLESPYPRSIAGGYVLHDGLPTVDLLQAALDVVHSPARGTEQAQLIVDHVLSHLPRDDQ